jgi:hypothetical protein
MRSILQGYTARQAGRQCLPQRPEWWASWLHRLGCQRYFQARLRHVAVQSRCAVAISPQRIIADENSGFEYETISAFPVGLCYSPTTAGIVSGYSCIGGYQTPKTFSLTQTVQNLAAAIQINWKSQDRARWEPSDTGGVSLPTGGSGTTNRPPGTGDSSPTTKSSHGPFGTLSTGAFAGIVGGATVGLGLLFAFVVFYRRRRKRAVMIPKDHNSGKQEKTSGIEHTSEWQKSELDGRDVKPAAVELGGRPLAEIGGDPSAQRGVVHELMSHPPAELPVNPAPRGGETGRYRSGLSPDTSSGFTSTPSTGTWSPSVVSPTSHSANSPDPLRRGGRDC